MGLTTFCRPFRLCETTNQRNIREKIDELHNDRLACDGRNFHCLADNDAMMAKKKKRPGRHLEQEA